MLGSGRLRASFVSQAAESGRRYKRRSRSGLCRGRRTQLEKGTFAWFRDLCVYTSASSLAAYLKPRVVNTGTPSFRYVGCNTSAILGSRTYGDAFGLDTCRICNKEP